jgi:hypothetical protein
LDQCLQRYRHLRGSAQSEGWWEGISAVRRQELEEHAKLLTRISEMIRPVLPPGADAVEFGSPAYPIRFALKMSSEMWPAR